MSTDKGRWAVSSTVRVTICSKGMIGSTTVGVFVGALALSTMFITGKIAAASRLKVMGNFVVSTQIGQDVHGGGGSLTAMILSMILSHQR